jgi:hypothetical protein
MDMVKSMRLVKELDDRTFRLIIHNKVNRSFVLPNPTRTDVRNPNNMCYIPNLETDQAPTHIHGNVAAGGGDEFVPPAHTPHFSNTFAGNSSSYREQEERDGLFYAIHQQQEVMMADMHIMRAQQTQILHNQVAMQNQFRQSEEYNRHQLNRVIDELGGLRLKFDDFQHHQHPPP